MTIDAYLEVLGICVIGCFFCCIGYVFVGFGRKVVEALLFNER